MENPTLKPPREKSFIKVLSALKSHPDGVSDIFEDGVLRVFDGPFDRNVVDAVGLSPNQIKQCLDMRLWSQEIEDKFRGVDGRKVVDYDALFNPPPQYRLPKHTEESWEIYKAEIAEMNAKLKEQMEKDERDGVNMAEKYACTRKVSNYDLSPRESSK